jgi:hypothetical protein
MTRRPGALAAVGAILACAVALIAVELASGAPSFGETASADPCGARVDYPGKGLDADVQRIVLDGLDGAACRLGTTREGLLLSFAPDVTAVEIRWDDATIERAVRAGLARSIDDAEARGSIDGVVATVLREVVKRLPVDELVRGGFAASDVVKALRQGDLGGLLDRLGLDRAQLDDLLGRLDLGGLLGGVLGG